MSTRNIIILVIVVALDFCALGYGLYMKNISVDAEHETLMYRTIEQKTIERQSDLINEVSAVEDSLKKCCNR